MALSQAPAIDAARVSAYEVPTETPGSVCCAPGRWMSRAGADQIPLVMQAQPIATEGIDDKLVEDMKLLGLHPKNIEMLPDGNGWLLVEFGGNTPEEATQKAKNLMEELRGNGKTPTMKLFSREEREQKIWTVRKSVSQLRIIGAAILAIDVSLLKS